MVRQTAKEKNTGPTLLVGVDVLQTLREWQAHRRVYLGVVPRAHTPSPEARSHNGAGYVLYQSSL